MAFNHCLNQPMLKAHQAVSTVLQSSIHHKKELMVRTILQTLETLQDDSTARSLAQNLGQLAPMVLAELTENEDWRIHPEISALLDQPGSCPLDYSSEDVLAYIEPLLQDQNPLIQTACLYLIAQLNPEKGKAIALNLQGTQLSPLLQETSELLRQKPASKLADFPKLEKAVHLFNSDFFHRMQTQTLLALVDRAEVRTYAKGDVITEAGDTCRELLLLIEGDAKIHYYSQDEVRVESLHPGQTLDELEVLARSDSTNTIIADSQVTRILAVAVDAFDDLLDLDHDFARRVMELESRQLQRFMRSLQPLN
jgi:CRP-like cAMP-binding protein